MGGEMPMQLIHLALVFTIDSYTMSGSGDITSTATYQGTNLNCTCSSISSGVCMNYACTTTIQKPSCFPGISRIALEDGTFKPLSDIIIGEHVLVNEHGLYEPVLAFIHGEPDQFFSFFAINIQSTVSNVSSKIFISSDHLMFDFDSRNARFARSFHVGDHVQLIENGQLVSGEIIDIQQTRQKGFYAPLTPSGTIVVDGVLCSNYALVENHVLAHKAMGIYRWWIGLIGAPALSNEFPWILGIMYNAKKILELLGVETLLSSYI